MHLFCKSVNLEIALLHGSMFCSILNWSFLNLFEILNWKRDNQVFRQFISPCPHPDFRMSVTSYTVLLILLLFPVSSVSSALPSSVLLLRSIPKFLVYVSSPQSAESSPRSLRGRSASRQRRRPGVRCRLPGRRWRTCPCRPARLWTRTTAARSTWTTSTTSVSQQTGVWPWHLNHCLF